MVFSIGYTRWVSRGDWWYFQLDPRAKTGEVQQFSKHTIPFDAVRTVVRATGSQRERLTSACYTML